jgi:hypothetical protein
MNSAPRIDWDRITLHPRSALDLLDELENFSPEEQFECAKAFNFPKHEARFCAAGNPDEDVDALAGRLEEIRKNQPYFVGAEAWGKPLLLGTPTVPEFPVEALPDWTRKFVHDVSNAMGNPPDLAAMSVLGIMAAALSKKAEVQVNESHREPLALYLCGVSPPGDGKSPTLKMAAAPLHDWERDERVRLMSDIEAECAEFDALEKEREQLARKVANAEEGARKDELRTRMKDSARCLAGRQRPELPRFIADDFTPAALGMLMVRNAGRMCVLNDEGNELFQILGGKHAANGGTEATLFKKAWSGERINTDRVSREHVGLEAPLLNVVVAIQPSALRGMAARHELTGLGVLDRFLFAVPDSRMAPPDAPPVPIATQKHYADGVRELLLLPLDRYGETNGEPVPVALRMDAEADDEHIAFNREVNQLVEDGESLQELRGWASKLKANMIRTAGVLHLATWCGHRGLEEPITGDTMRQAVRIARYWMVHTRKAFDLMDADPQTLKARKVWAWVKRRAERSKLDVGGTFRKQDAWQDVRGSRGTIKTTDDIDSALRTLCDAHYLRRICERPEVYEVNPSALDLD